VRYGLDASVAVEASFPPGQARPLGAARAAMMLRYAMSERHGGLLAWQLAGYPEVHRDRRNLLLHAVTEPVFVAGALSVPGSLLGGHPLGAISGVAAMVVVMVLQGRGHALEASPPAPFRGPLDVVARIFAEQLVTFPRFVLGGGFARAWRAASAGPPATERRGR
jgi:hypothetical protein